MLVVITHGAVVGNIDPAAEEGGRRVARAKGGQLLNHLEGDPAKLAQRDLGVNVKEGTEVGTGQLTGRCLGKTLLEVSQVLSGQGKAGCLGVAAEMGQQVAALAYGMGNVKSVLNALDYIGEEAIITHSKSEIENASHIILPGVGAFGKAIENLKRRGLIEILNREVLEKGKSFLGICWRGAEKLSKRGMHPIM